MAGETEWFEGVKPARDGVYQVQGPEWPGRVMYALWKDGYWRMAMPALEFAGRQLSKSILMYERGVSWRGLLEEAK